jgi:hypothetical protein
MEILRFFFVINEKKPVVCPTGYVKRNSGIIIPEK